MVRRGDGVEVLVAAWDRAWSALDGAPVPGVEEGIVGSDAVIVIDAVGGIGV